MILHMYILATRVLTHGHRFTFWSSNYWYPLRVSALPDCRSHGCSGDNQFDSEAGPLKCPSSWGIVAMVHLVFARTRRANGTTSMVWWMISVDVDSDIFTSLHLGSTWDSLGIERYWTWLKIWVFRSPFVDWKWSEGPKTQDNSAVFCCEAAQLRCWVAWGTWKRDWNDLSAVSL